MTSCSALTWALDKARDFGDCRIYRGRLPLRMVREITGWLYRADEVTIHSDSFGQYFFTIAGLENAEFLARLPQTPGAESEIECHIF